MHQSVVLNSALVLDSQEIFGSALASILVGIKIVQHARPVKSFDEAVQAIESDPQICLVIVETTALGKAGPAAVTMLRNRFQYVRVVVVSAASTRDEILSYVASGAHGFVLKTQTGKEIVKAIQIVLSGNVFLPPMVTDLTPVDCNSTTENMADVQVVNAASGLQNGASVNSDVAGHIHLSSRQQAVLQLISKGLSNKAIARELGLAESTVKVHINNVFKALKVNNRIEAVARAGWLN